MTGAAAAAAAAAHARLVYISSFTAPQTQEIIQVLATALAGNTQTTAAGASSVQLGNGNIVLEIQPLPGWVSSLRHSRLLNRPRLTRLAHVDLITNRAGAVAGGGGGDVMKLLDVSPWLTEDRPIVTPSIRIGVLGSKLRSSTIPSTTSTSSSSSACRLREIVLGTGKRLEAMATKLTEEELEPLAGLPHVYALSPPHSESESESQAQAQAQTAVVRLLPSIMSSLVLQVDDLGQVKENMWRRDVAFEEIGGTGAAEGQVLLSSPLLRGLDIRLCDASAALSPYFNEGDEELTENVLEELNPAIQQQQRQGAATGAAASSPAALYRQMEGTGTGMGDCWSEFRSQMKRPSGFFVKK